MLKLNKLYLGDCLDIMQKIDDKSIDMILCDLPYGTTQNKWDSVIDLNKLWFCYNRIIKDNGAIVLTAQTPFDKILGYSNIDILRYEWIWEKEQGTGFLNSKKMPMKIHENILIFYKNLPIYNPEMRFGFNPYKAKSRDRGSSNYNNGIGLQETINEDGSRYPTTILKFGWDKQQKFHPTQKPVKLFEYLIKTYTNEDMIVLDNCSGSGTTAAACINTNRNFICIEKDEDIFKKSIERVKLNTNLFSNKDYSNIIGSVYSFKF
jgi:DNA modification methylase